MSLNLVREKHGNKSLLALQLNSPITVGGKLAWVALSVLGDFWAS